MTSLLPPYSPDYQFNVGLIGTIVDDHFANANNSAARFVPPYQFWDLTAKVKFCRVVPGFSPAPIHLDGDFWAEVRDEGILPAYGRNYYAGVSLKF